MTKNGTSDFPVRNQCLLAAPLLLFDGKRPFTHIWRPLSTAKGANHNIIDALEGKKWKKEKKTVTSRSAIDNLCSPSREKELI